MPIMIHCPGKLGAVTGAPTHRGQLCLPHDGPGAVALGEAGREASCRVAGMGGNGDAAGWAGGVDTGVTRDAKELMSGCRGGALQLHISSD